MKAERQRLEFEQFRMRLGYALEHLLTAATLLGGCFKEWEISDRYSLVDKYMTTFDGWKGYGFGGIEDLAARLEHDAWDLAEDLQAAIDRADRGKQEEPEDED